MMLVRIPLLQVENDHTAPAKPYNLRLETALVKALPYLPWVHGVMFVLFLMLMTGPEILKWLGVDGVITDGVSELSLILVWGLWFPLVLLSVVVSGRSWCGILCPMGAASEWASKWGLNLKAPRWIMWSGVPVLTFILVTLLGQTAGVREYTDSVARVFGSIMLMAIVVGWLFAKGKRIWCRHACPIGLLLGVFSRLGMVQLLPKKPKAGNEGYTSKGPCPTFIDLRRKKESRHCIQCFRCVHPNSKAGLELAFHRPGYEVEKIANNNGNATEMWFFFLASGLMLGAFQWSGSSLFEQLRQRLGELFIRNGQYWIGDSGPAWLMSVHPEQREVFNWLDFFSINIYMISVMLLVACGLACLTWLQGRFGGSLRQYRHKNTVSFSYSFMPVVLVSLLLGLGATLFHVFGGYSQAVKLLVLLVAGVWSLWLAYRIHKNVELPSSRLFVSLGCNGVGVMTLGWLWGQSILSF